MKRGILMLMLITYLAAITHPVESANLSFDETYLCDRINEVRTREGLGRLRISDRLTGVAREHSLEMLTFGYFDHISQVDGSTPYDRVVRSGYYDGYYHVRVVSENIGLTRPGINVDSLMKAWMESEGHAENILSNHVNEIGGGIALGVFEGRGETALITAVFAYRAEVSGNATATTLHTETSILPKSTNQTYSSTTILSTKIDSATTSSTSKTGSTVTRQLTTQNLTTLTSTYRSINTITAVVTGTEWTSLTHHGDELKLQIVSNSTILNLLFHPKAGMINLTVTGSEGTGGFCNASIPKSILDGSPIVIIDGKQVESELKEDTANHYVYFTYSHSSHNIMIGGSNTISEFPHIATAILSVFTIISLLASTFARKTDRRGFCKDKSAHSNQQ